MEFLKKKYNTGLVLSGGGTRGFAHLGIIAALYEKGIVPDVISGTSVGSIVGAFIASGKSPKEVLAIFKKGWFFRFTKLNLPVNGLLKLDGLKEVIQKEIEVKNIEDLKIPFYISVSNLNKGTVEYKHSGPLGETVLASSSIPILFSPVKLGNELYVDGGVVDNIPIKPVINDCEQLIVCNISPINPREKVKNLVQITSRTFYMNVNSHTNEIAKSASVYIEPEGIDKYEILSLSHAEELYNLGYDSTINLLQKQSSGLI
jgi:NTE family protein